MSRTSPTSLGHKRALARRDEPPPSQRRWLLRMPVPWSLWPATIFFLVYLVAPLAVVFYYSLQPNPLTSGSDAGLSFGN
jgi:hypothetical protein